MDTLCPCGSNKHFDQCCGAIINGKNQATTATELMRSRYTAFTLADVDYLMRSYHSRTRPIRERKQIQAWAKSVKWIGLQILVSEMGNTDDSIGYVEFRAIFSENGKMDQIHEKSLFEREKGNWVYVNGSHY